MKSDKRRGSSMCRAWLPLLALLGLSPPALVAGTDTYAYDTLGRLTAVRYGNGAEILYSYDAAGNRLTQAVTVPAADTDGDGLVDAQDPDDDNDGVADAIDAFPLNAAETLDTDGDGVGNNADPDDDNDGVADAADAFPLDPSQWLDSDGDGVGDPSDNCPGVANADQADADGDGLGNACDADYRPLCLDCIPSWSGWRGTLLE